MSELSIARQYSHTPQVEHRAGLPRDFRVMHRDFGVDPSSSFVSVAVTTALEPCADQLALARASLTQHSKQLGRKFVTEISPLEVFWVSVLAVLAHQMLMLSGCDAVWDAMYGTTAPGA